VTFPLHHSTHQVNLEDAQILYVPLCFMEWAISVYKAYSDRLWGDLQSSSTFMSTIEAVTNLHFSRSWKDFSLSLSHSLTHSPSLTHSHSHTHSHTHSHSHTHTLSHSLTHTHTHTHTRTHTHTPLYHTALRHHYSVVSFAMLRVLSCIHLTGLRCSCNVVKFCCDPEARNLATTTTHI
jgi:hypothetical protein